MIQTPTRALLAALLLSATPVWAQTPDQDADPTNTVQDEIIVTAQRRAEAVTDVPVALTVLGTDELQTLQIEDTLDLQAFVPNLNLGTNTGTANAARIFLRGVGEDESRGAVEPAVGTYVDGVYVGRIVGALFDLVDIEQIEVLRGPQGTLYGRNSNGGAIKISTLKPTTEGFGASGRVTYGNYDRLDVKGSVNVPIGDVAALRVSGLYKTRDGYFDIIPNGGYAGTVIEDVGDLDTMAIRGSLSFDVGDNWNVLVIADYTDDDSDPIPSTVADYTDADGDLFTVEPFPGTACAGVPADITAPAGAFQFTRPVGCFAGFSNETKSQGISGTVTGSFGDLQFQSISAFRRLDDELSSHIGFPYLQETDQEQASQEFTLSSDYAGPFNFVAGLYWFKEDLNLDTAFVFPFEVRSDTESYAAFGQGEFEVGEFTLTGGLRYTTEDREYQGRNLVSNLFNNAEQETDKVSYQAKVDWNPSDDVLLYASWATGFKGAGFSPDCFGPTACFLPVDEEEVRTIEFGLKSSFWDRRMRFNATYFDNAYDDLQIAATVPGLGFTRFNVEETGISGFEFDMTFQPTPDFMLMANLGLLDGQYEEVTQAQASALTNAGVPCPGGIPTIDCALGLELKNAPDWKANVSALYSLDFAGGAIDFSGNIAWEDSSFSLVANSPPNAESDIPTLVNLRAAFRPGDGDWYVALWGKNIFDEEYYRAATATAQAVYAAEPGTYGVDIGFDF